MSKEPPSRAMVRYALGVFALAMAYYWTGRVGLQFPYHGQIITLLWPPTGIATAAMVLGGLRLWPGVYLAAWMLNAETGCNLATTLSIAVTNTLAPVLGAWLLRNVFDFRPNFSRQRDLVVFLFIGALGPMLISATGGVLSLWLSNRIESERILQVWGIWWLGDAMGVVLAAPPILAVCEAPAAWRRIRERGLETAVAFAGLGIVAAAVFLDVFSLGFVEVVLALIPFPIVIWIAIRGDVWTTSLATLLLSSIAIFATAVGSSPFVRNDVHTGLILLWIYLGTVSLMSLLVSALQAERAEAESVVLRSKAEMETIFRALPDLYFRMSADGVILDYHAAQMSDLYVQPSQFLGRRMVDILPEDVGRRISDAIARSVTSREPVEIEYDLTLGKGSQEFEARFVALPGEQVLAVIRNITDRKRAGRELARSEARFRAFMQNGPVIALIKDADLRYQYANRCWETQFDPPRSDWMGKTDFDFFPEETARLFNESDRSVLANRASVERVESGPGPDGDTRHWITFKFTLEDDLGRPLIGGCILDITQAKRIEEQLRHSQKMEAIGQLAGGIAHDFNNLLTVINGYTSLMLHGLAETHPWHTFLKDISRSGERAAELTQQLLAFSRKQVLQPRILDVNSSIEQEGKMLRRLLGDHIDLSLDLEPYLPPVKVDPGQLEQSIVNLAVNARDAMLTGGSLTISTRSLRGDEAAAAGKPLVVLSVADTGTGMDAATCARIFEPFFTTKGVGKGTGLGLSMVYGFVQQSGGRIEVASEPGKGTRFDIYLPASAEAIPNLTPPPPAPLPTGNETVLLVEDEDYVRNLVRTVLSRCGYTVLEARHGKHAIEVVAQHSGPIHLLVSDLQMPQMNGRDLADQLLRSRPNLKVLFISGYADSRLREQGIETPFPLLEKPFSPSDLANRVRILLGGFPFSGKP